MEQQVRRFFVQQNLEHLLGDVIPLSGTSDDEIKGLYCMLHFPRYPNTYNVVELGNKLSNHLSLLVGNGNTINVAIIPFRDGAAHDMPMTVGDVSEADIERLVSEAQRASRSRTVFVLGVLVVLAALAISMYSAWGPSHFGRY